MSKHITVLLDEAVELLDVKPDGIYIDGTLGRGGHTKMILDKLTTGHLYSFDLDEEAIKESKERLKDYNNITYIHDNYKNMNKYVDKVDGILLDLGVSSPQFDEADRGFSYRFDGPLDMRMDQEQELTAEVIVNTYSENELIRILRDYGEEKFARNIAKAIVNRRTNLGPIKTTTELVETIKSALPQKVLSKKGHPAKQSFQALRIEVNHELDSLTTFLNSFHQISRVGTRVSIITFHSLEDRLVKHKFKELSTVEDDLTIAKLPSEIETPDWQLINRHPILESEEKLDLNPRAKSAKLRGIKRIK